MLDELSSFRRGVATRRLAVCRREHLHLQLLSRRHDRLAMEEDWTTLVRKSDSIAAMGFVEIRLERCSGHRFFIAGHRWLHRHDKEADQDEVFEHRGADRGRRSDAELPQMMRQVLIRERGPVLARELSEERMLGPGALLFFFAEAADEREKCLEIGVPSGRLRREGLD